MKKEKRTLLFNVNFIFPLLALMMLAFTGIGVSSSYAADKSLPNEIAINCPPTGVQYVQAAAVAAIIEKYTTMKGFTEPTKSHVSAMPLFQEKKMDLIFVSESEMYLANRGTEYYESVGPTPIRIIAAGTEIMFGFFTSPKTGIEKFEDLAGKKVMWATKSAGVFYWAGKYVLDYYKLNDKIISIPSPSPADRAEALKMGRIDVYTCSAQFAAMEIIHSSVGMRILDIPIDAAEWVQKQYPALYPVIIPKGYNGGMVERDVPSLAAGTALQGRATLEDHVVYAVLEAIYDHFEEFNKPHPTLKDMTLDRAVSLNSINPYHTGAIQFYKDRGVWTPEAEAMQQRLLKELKATL